MTALEEYRKAPSGQGHTTDGTWFPAVHSRYADAAIAELSSEANKLTEDWGDAQKSIAELEAENADLRGLLLVIGSSHPHLVPHIDAYLAARAEEGSK